MEAVLALYLGFGSPIELLMPDIMICREAVVEAIRDFGPVKAECLTGILTGVTVTPPHGRQHDYSPPRGCKWSTAFVECRQ